MPDATEQAIVANEQYSVRQFAPGAWGGMVGGDALGFLWPRTAEMLPRWGTYECDLALRVMHYTQHNSLVGGAVQVFIEKFLSIPHEISGGKNLTFRWQDILAESEFGEGYDVLVGKGLVDYLTLNRGWFMELVSYGKPDTPIKEGAKILGINHLDAMRIQFTGNREYPYLYMSEWGGELHKMHYTRVIRVARQPSPDTMWYGMGKSSLYDALTVANAQILLGKHQNELLSDMPPPGIVLFNNVTALEVKTAMTQFEMMRVRDGQNVFRAPLSMSSKDPSQPATVTFVPMSTVPENFNYKEYMDIHVNLTALSFGLDPQDLWPLTGSSIGTGQQSKVLAAKTDVKGPGFLANILTPIWNFRVFPPAMEWKYKAQNPEQDRQTADTAQVWLTTLNTVSYLTNDEKRGVAANQVPAIADELMDEQGQIRLFDDDIKEPEQVTATSAVEMDAAGSNANDVTMTGDNQTAMMDAPQTELQPTNALTKLPSKRPIVPAVKPTTSAPAQGVKPIVSTPVAPAVDNAFKQVKEQLDAGLITITDAQKKLGITPDPIYDGMYMIEGYPVPRNVVGQLWQAHFGRGVASFDAVVSGATMPSGFQPSDATNTQQPVTKDIDATNDEFIQEMQAIIQDGLDRTITKAGCAARIRGAIQRYGKSAYQDGLEVGGVDASELDEDDKRVIGDISVHSTQYVTNLVDDIYTEGASFDAESRAQMWMGTTDEFYYEGIASADKNGMYEFMGDDGNESCATCQRLKGERHRMKWWIDKELRPGIDHDSFECGGWRCEHYLEKVIK